jgi:hypothetical protein
MLVEAFTTQSSVKALDKGVLDRLSGLDKGELDIVAVELLVSKLWAFYRTIRGGQPR